MTAQFKEVVEQANLLNFQHLTPDDSQGLLSRRAGSDVAFFQPTPLWGGQSAAIRQGVRVGDGALVGMGAVVVKDVEPGVVVMGNPAVVKKRR